VIVTVTKQRLDKLEARRSLAASLPKCFLIPPDDPARSREIARARRFEKRGGLAVTVYIQSDHGRTWDAMGAAMLAAMFPHDGVVP
jgi:hypothetical protein